jgi:phosphotransferase system HPr (HPr) family protein
MRVKCPEGLQIRGAFHLAKLAQTCKADILLRHDGYLADAKSLMGILRLGVLSNDSVTITVAGEDSSTAWTRLQTLLELPGPQVFVAEIPAACHMAIG